MFLRFSIKVRGIMDKIFEQDLLENYDKYPKQYFADKYNVSIGYIFSLGTKMGLSRTKKWVEQKDDIINDYKNGFSIEKLSKKYKHDSRNLKDFLIKNCCCFRE